MRVGPSSVSCRLVARAVDLGFAPPPLALLLKIVKSGPHWSLFLQSVPPGPIGRAAEWLEPHAPRRMEFGAGHVLRADFDSLPHEWMRAFEDVNLDALHLDPDGTAIVTVTGERAATVRFAARLEARSHDLDVRHVAPARAPRRLLTAPQEAAIRAAIQHGYYDIPRPINLHQLAEKLGVSSASLSERLRRAEGRIIRRYATGAAGGWLDGPADDPPPAPPRWSERTDMPEKPPLEEG